MDKKKILLVDDEAVFTDTLKLNLEVAGDYDVKVVNDPLSALQVARNFMPDLVLMDIIMPEKEGPDLAVDIRNDEALSTTPVVFLTATVKREEVDSQNGWIGGHPFVAKPSTLKELIDSIEKNILAAY